MRKKLLQIVSIIVILSLLGACAAQPTAAPAKKWKMAVLFPGVITDADYNTLGYIALTTVKSELNIETAYSESVPVPDAERVMREYLDAGYNIIFTHGNQFITQAQTLAKAFPDRTFIVEADGPIDGRPDNMWSIERNFHVGYYAMGYIAARLTKSGKIGYIAGLTLPFSYSEVRAMQQAIKDKNLKAELKPVWTGDFNDPTKGRQVADAMIAEGIDVIVCSLNLGVFGVFESVKASGKPVLVTAKYIDKSSFAPNNYASALLYDFKGPLKDVVSKVMAGEKGQVYQLGFQTGVSVQLPLKNAPADVSKDVETLVNDIKTGKINVVKDFTPVK